MSFTRHLSPCGTGSAIPGPQTAPALNSHVPCPLSSWPHPPSSPYPPPSSPCRPEFQILLFWNSSAVLCGAKQSSSYQSNEPSERLTSYFPWFLSSLHGQLDGCLAPVARLIVYLRPAVVRMATPRECEGPLVSHSRAWEGDHISLEN